MACSSRRRRFVLKCRRGIQPQPSHAGFHCAWRLYRGGPGGFGRRHQAIAIALSIERKNPDLGSPPLPSGFVSQSLRSGAHSAGEIGEAPRQRGLSSDENAVDRGLTAFSRHYRRRGSQRSSGMRRLARTAQRLDPQWDPIFSFQRLPPAMVPFFKWIGISIFIPEGTSLRVEFGIDSCEAGGGNGSFPCSVGDWTPRIGSIASD